MLVYNLIILILGLIILSAFFYFNSGNIVPTINLGIYEKSNLPINLVLFWTFLAGIFYGLLFAIAQEFRLRKRLRRLKKEFSDLQDELNSLRQETIDSIFKKKE
ncbi:MAG: lipopolysaccharide assembly protein LapA domain-containing protein [bacterium]